MNEEEMSVDEKFEQALLKKHKCPFFEEKKSVKEAIDDEKLFRACLLCKLSDIQLALASLGNIFKKSAVLQLNEAKSREDSGDVEKMLGG